MRPPLTPPTTGGQVQAWLNLIQVLLKIAAAVAHLVFLILVLMLMVMVVVALI